jgi:hypothetical protein
MKLNSIAYVLFVGQRDQGSSLSKLPFWIVKKIYLDHVLGFYTKHINYNGVFASVVAQIATFPEFTGINVNMMPIILGNSFSIPENCRQYIPLLAACTVDREEYGKVVFLTIHESVTEEDETSQRRAGRHVVRGGSGYFDPVTHRVAPGGQGKWSIQHFPPMTVAWGRGYYHPDLSVTSRYQGGLYMASNVDDSTRVWNCEIVNSEDVVNTLGDLEHLRPFLGSGNLLRSGEMVWMSDTTPHESLPLKQGTRRQYFRLVTSNVSVWYEEHSTPNPLGVEPPEDVIILKGSKFREDIEDEKSVSDEEERETREDVVL